MHIEPLKFDRELEKQRHSLQLEVKFAKFCTIIGIIVILFGIKSYNKYSHYVVTDAILVTQNGRYRDDDTGHYRYRYKAAYTVGDETYTITTYTYSDKDIGKVIPIRYNPKYPSVAVTGDNSTNGGLALFGFAVTIACMLYGANAHMKLQNL